MCFSTDAIEKQSYELANRIQKLSIYKFHGVECLGGKIIKSIDFNSTCNDTPLITTIFLEDDIGNLYSIKPDPIGLKFAKGNMTYKEYKRMTQQDVKQGLGVLILSIGLYTSLGCAFIYFAI